MKEDAGGKALVHRGSDQPVVLRHELVQAGGAAAEMTEDEDRGMLDGRSPNGGLGEVLLFLWLPHEGGERAVVMGREGGREGRELMEPLTKSRCRSVRRGKEGGREGEKMEGGKEGRAYLMTVINSARCQQIGSTTKLCRAK